MGAFSQTLRLDSIDGERSLEVDALVDTGAFFTMVLARLLSHVNYGKAACWAL